MGSKGPDIRLRRIYDEPANSDGTRVLVDRLWPRGVRKAHASLDAHLPQVAPSNELRRWYGHDADRYDEFVERYLAELKHGEAADALARLRALGGEGRLTLLTATREVDRSHAHVLAELLRGRLNTSG